MSKKLTKSIVFYGIGAGLSQSLIILLLPAYTSVLDEVSYGAFELIYAFFLLLNLIGMSQIDSALGRFYFEAKSEEERNSYLFTGFVIVSFISILLGVLVFFCSTFFSNLLFQMDAYANAFKIIAFTIPVINCYNLFLIILRFNNKPWLFTGLSIIQVLVTGLLTLWFLFSLEFGVSGILFANIFGFLIGLILVSIYYKDIFKSTFNKEIKQSYFKFSIPLFPAVIGSWVNNHSSKFLFLIYLSTSQLGLFTAALKVASLFKFGDYVFRMAWTPFYLEEIKKKNHKHTFKKVYELALLVFGIAVILFHFIKKPLAQLLFSKVIFYEAVPYISLLAFSFVITILVQIIGTGPVITKKTIYNTYNFIFSLSLFFIAFFILTPIYGIYGVVYSQVIGSLALFTVSWYNSNKLYPIKFSIIKTVFFIIVVLGVIL